VLLILLPFVNNVHVGSKRNKQKFLWRSGRIDGTIDMEQSGEKLKNYLTGDHF